MALMYFELKSSGKCRKRDYRQYQIHKGKELIISSLCRTFSAVSMYYSINPYPGSHVYESWDFPGFLGWEDMNVLQQEEIMKMLPKLLMPFFKQYGVGNMRNVREWISSMAGVEGAAAAGICAL